MKRKIVASMLLALLLVQSTSGYTTEPQKPIEQGQFTLLAPTPTPTPTQIAIIEPTAIPATPEPTKKPQKVGIAKPLIENKPIKINLNGAVLFGKATWYCKTGVSRCTIGHPGGMYAAIRRDLLYLRGQKVKVCGIDTGVCVYVTIIDCNCGKHANLIDLYSDAFQQIAPLGLGRIKVKLFS